MANDYRLEMHYAQGLTTVELTCNGVTISEGTCAGKNFRLATKRMRESRWQMRDLLRAAELKARSEAQTALKAVVEEQAAFMAIVGLSTTEERARAMARSQRLEAACEKRRAAKLDRNALSLSFRLFGG